MYTNVHRAFLSHTLTSLCVSVSSLPYKIVMNWQKAELSESRTFLLSVVVCLESV